MSKDYYKILGVAEFDSAEEIKKAYRKLARELHPDVAGNGERVLERFKEINEAYATLSDKVKKEEYDKARRFYNYAKNENYADSTFKETSTHNKTNINFNFSDFFSKKSNENFTNRSSKALKNGNNIYSEIEITPTEAMLGTSKTINVLQTSLCPKCNGRRFINGTKCSVCNGTGEHAQYSKITVKIPAGIKNKSKIRLSGEGEKGLYGGSNGDLYLTINIKKIGESFKTSNFNIYKTVNITPFEAILGTEIKLNTPSGDVNMIIPAYTQNGQKFNLSGCGNVQKEKIGDMIITVEIKIPNNLTNEEISLYKKLRAISSSSIRDIDNDR